jgi:hypothetical protein
MKQCYRCHDTKTLNEFASDSSRVDGKRNVCKLCYNASAKTSNAKLRCKRKEIRDNLRKTAVVQVHIPTSKVCKTCKHEKFLEEFHPDEHKYLGVRNDCKECFNTAAREYKTKKRAEIKLAGSEHLPKTNGSCNLQQPSKTKQEKEEMHKEKRRTYARELYHTDFKYRIRNLFGCRIRNAMYNSSHEKGKTLDYIGCSLKFFRAWIESQFKDTLMNWNNMGSYWHFDHINPVKAFDFNDDTQIHRCFHWSNIRPCPGIENLIKNDKIDTDLIQQYKNKAAIFEK